MLKGRDGPTLPHLRKLMILKREKKEKEAEREREMGVKPASQHQPEEPTHTHRVVAVGPYGWLSHLLAVREKERAKKS